MCCTFLSKFCISGLIESHDDLSLICVYLSEVYAKFGWKLSIVSSSQSSLHVVVTADTLSGQLWVYGQGQNCLPCHLLCLTFKTMKRRESDPWQDLFKEQPLGDGGGGVPSLAACWGIDQPLSQRPNTESLARGEGHAGCAAILGFEALSNTSAASPHE